MWRIQEEIVSSGYVTALTLQQKLKYSGKAYVLGNASLAAELSQVGVTSVSIGVSANAEASVTLSIHTMLAIGWYLQTCRLYCVSVNKKLSYRRETALCFVSLNILLTHSRSL